MTPFQIQIEAQPEFLVAETFTSSNVELLRARLALGAAELAVGSLDRARNALTSLVASIPDALCNHMLTVFDHVLTTHCRRGTIQDCRRLQGAGGGVFR